MSRARLIAIARCGRSSSTRPSASVPVLQFVAMPNGWQEARWSGACLGSVASLKGRRWRARQPDGQLVGFLFSSRQSAGEHLRRKFERDGMMLSSIDKDVKDQPDMA